MAIRDVSLSTRKSRTRMIGVRRGNQESYEFMTFSLEWGIYLRYFAH